LVINIRLSSLSFFLNNILNKWEGNKYLEEGKGGDYNPPKNLKDWIGGFLQYLHLFPPTNFTFAV